MTVVINTVKPTKDKILTDCDEVKKSFNFEINSIFAIYIIVPILLFNF